MKDFAYKLKELRKEKKIRQIDLADYLGFCRSTITNYEQGIRFPSLDVLCKIADFFNVSLDYLLGRSSLKKNFCSENELDKIFLIVDTDGNIIDFNRPATSVLGYDKKELKNMNILNISIEDRETVLNKLKKAKNNKDTVFYCKRKIANGQTKEVQLHTGPLFTEGTILLHSFINSYNIHNITETKYKNTVSVLINILSSLVNNFDPFKLHHEKNVAWLACSIGRKLKLKKERIELLEICSLLHDIGKIHIPDKLLIKPNVLSVMEYNIIKEHTTLGYKMLKDIDLDKCIPLVALQHHERLDGSGYPEGLLQDDIILEARIIAVADTVEAMLHNRPHRPAKNKMSAINELVKYKKIKYDEKVVDACLEIITKRDFNFMY